MTPEEIRLQALKLAVSGGEIVDAEHVVKRAEAFAEFLSANRQSQSIEGILRDTEAQTDRLAKGRIAARDESAKFWAEYNERASAAYAQAEAARQAGVETVSSADEFSAVIAMARAALFEAGGIELQRQGAFARMAAIDPTDAKAKARAAAYNALADLHHKQSSRRGFWDIPSDVAFRLAG